jgi:hypothetical protein
MRVVIASALMLLASSAMAQQQVNHRRVSTADPSIRIQGDLDAVRVIGWEHDSVALTGVVPAGTRVEAAFGPEPERVRGAKIFVEAPGRTSLPGKGGTLELRVPSRARVWVKSGTAAIDASGVTGGLDLNIVGGSIRVSGSPRELRAESMDGNVRVEGRPGWARLKTATGDITLAGGGEDVGLSSVSGAIRVTEGSIERGRIETVTGLVVIAAVLGRGSDVAIDTHSGPVEVRLLPNASVELDAISLTGRINNAWNAARPIAGREGRGQELGTGSGAALVGVRSFKGTITFTILKR